MEIRIVARHFDLTSALQERITKKIRLILGHFSSLTDCMVTLCNNKTKDKSKSNHVEINVQLKNKSICAKSDNADMYAAIEAAAKKLDRQILSHKAMIKNHHHQPLKKMEAMQQMVAQDDYTT
jgi:putative sigma-54 modulation protein